MKTLHKIGLLCGFLFWPAIAMAQLSAGTYYLPAGGGGVPNATEAAVTIASPSATTVLNLAVSISSTLGGSSTGFTVTLRKNNADTALTCTFNPSSATSCTDNNAGHSVSIAQGDLINWKVVTAGTIVGAPTVNISANNGTSISGVTSVTCNAGLSGGAITSSGTCSLNLGSTNAWTAQQSNCETTLTISTATFTPDGSCNNYKITLVHASCPCTLANPSATPVAGTAGVIRFIQSATGSDTIGTWGSQYITQGATSSITLSTGASQEDDLSYYVRDSTHILLAVASQNATH